MGSPPFLICKSCLVPLLPGPPAPGAVSQYSKQLHLRYFTYFAPGKGEPPHSRFTDGGKMQRAAFTPCAATKHRTRCLRPRRPLAVSGRLSPLLGSLKKKKTEMPAALGGRALPRTPPFLESSFPPTAMSGGHAGPVRRFFLAAAAAALPPHSPFFLFLPSLPP